MEGFSLRLTRFAKVDLEPVDNDDDFLGSGSFGDVHKYNLKNLGIVAVKQFRFTGSKASINKHQEM